MAMLRHRWRPFQLSFYLSITTHMSGFLYLEGGKKMGTEEFTRVVKKAIVAYFNENADKTDNAPIREDDVFIVWMCKTLQNCKAMASTTVHDQMYYELTYNGNKKELYLDAYKKWENRCLKFADQSAMQSAA